MFAMVGQAEFEAIGFHRGFRLIPVYGPAESRISKFFFSNKTTQFPPLIGQIACIVMVQTNWREWPPCVVTFRR